MKPVRNKSWIGVAWASALAGLVILCMNIAGCTTLNGIFDGSSKEMTAKIVVQVAVFNLLTDRPEYQKPLLDITGKVAAYVDGDPGARVDSIIALVNEQIRWDRLSPNDALAINTTLSLIEINLREQITNQTLPEDTKLKVKTVIGWINQVAATFAPQIPVQASNGEMNRRPWVGRLWAPDPVLV